MGSSMQSFYDGMALVGSLVIMAAVIALTYYASRWYAGRMRRSASVGNMKIIDRLSLAPGASIMAVQIGDRFYLLGVSDKNVRFLCELEDFVPEPVAAPGAQASFSRLLRGFMDRPGNSEDNGTEK